MKTTIITALATGAAAAAALLGPATPALAASSAELTIAQLEAQGFEVKTSRIGSAPIDECEVSSIGKGREQKRLERFGDDLIEVVVKRTIAVTLDCSR